MNITKAAAVESAGIPDAKQLEKINGFSRTPLQAEQVYVFSVRLCDDAVDRDYERFASEALPELAALFVGKTGICDHEWSAQRQIARIFDTEVQTDGETRFIQAWAYMLRSEETAGMIADIEGGIKKEVSVGCAMGAASCNICKKPYGTCSHQKGQVYDGVLCTAVLSEPVDAYEFSFVAVPAQKRAGVMKDMRGGACMKLEEYVAKSGDRLLMEGLQTMQKEAAMGRAYRKKLEDDMVRCALALDFGADEALLRTMGQCLDDESLQKLCSGLRQKAAQLFEPATQLPGARAQETDCGSEFMI